MAGILQFENVGLRYGTGAETLSDVSFSLAPGSFTFLTGPSGAGKTSLLKLLYLAQRPSRGLIRLFGEDIVTLPRSRLPAFRRKIGVVFQDFRLIPYLSAYDNVALPLRVGGLEEREIETRVPAANPCAVASVLWERSLDPTSTAMIASASRAAACTGRLSIVPPSIQSRPSTRPGGKNPGSAHEA